MGMPQDNCTYLPLATHPTPPFLSVCQGKQMGPFILATSPPGYRPGPAIPHRPPGRPCPPLALPGGLPPAVPVLERGAAPAKAWSGARQRDKWLQFTAAGWGGDKGRRAPSTDFSALFGGTGPDPLPRVSRGSPEGPGTAGTFSGHGCLRGALRLSSHAHPGPGRPLCNPGAQAGSWGGSAGGGRAGRGLPLVRGGLPGPGQPRAPHRLVPERAVLVDAAHSPRVAAPRTRDTARGRAEPRDSRRQLPPGRGRAWRSRAALKGPRPIFLPEEAARGCGLSSSFSLLARSLSSLFLEGDPNTCTKGKLGSREPIGSAL